MTSKLKKLQPIKKPTFFTTAVILFANVFFGSAYSTLRAQETPQWTIKIDAAVKHGPSRVKNFLFVQGGPLQATGEQGSNEASQLFEMAAWRALNLISETIWLFDDESGQAGGLFQIIRAAEGSASQPSHRIGPFGPKRDLYIDTQNFDAALKDWVETGGVAAEFCRLSHVSFMPKTLSSNPSAENYANYPPADYAEWRAVLEAVVRYLNQHGIDHPYLILFGEPESDTIFNVLSPDGKPWPLSTEPVLREYVRLYAESQRAVRAANSGAKVSAMCAGVWGADFFRELRGAPEQKGLDDFIAYVAEYNKTLPHGVEPAELDNICWQGYSWKDEKRMMPMAQHIQSVLERYGFDPDTPQYLSGWSGGWASPRGIDYPIGLYAPHLVYNVIEQLNPAGEPGPIAQAHYYTWNLEDAGNKSSLVRTVHDAISWGPAASDQNCLRPAYVAFQALKAMEKGEVLAVSKEARPLLARSMAVANDAGIRVLLVNYTDNPQQVHLNFEHLPKTARLGEAVLRRVPEKETCGDGNWFPAGDPMKLFLNEPLDFSENGSGTASVSIRMPANTVALVDIPA